MIRAVKAIGIYRARGTRKEDRGGRGHIGPWSIILGVKG